ncbi:MAG: V-type ATP synthase subunit D [Clostridia bacterium]
MALINVNPTRMELKRLKGRLKTATRGHKLLKDKTDEMIRQFIILARENKRLRIDVEGELAGALKSFMLAKAVSDEPKTEEAIMMPSRQVTLTCSHKSLMSVQVPVISIQNSGNGELYPYSFLTMSAELDNAVSTMNLLLEKLIRLAEVEKTCNMLAVEIEKNKRRVNALENIMIPQMQETIHYITMKLDEAERSATIRLMKVKSMIQKEN